MTNIERASEVLIHWADSLGGLAAIERDYDGDMAGAAEALADAGRLMPDLPEPQVVPTGMEDRVYLSWRGDPVDVEQSARIAELFAPGESFPILSLDANQARSLGLRLLAAADYAERNHHEHD